MIRSLLTFLRRRALWVLAAACLAFAILNGVLGSILDSDSRAAGPWLLREKWALLQQPQEAQWLFLGDSACSQALDPKVWQEETGQTALNLCTTEHTGLVNAAWMFNQFLRDHPNPRHVVLLNTPTTWRLMMDAELVRHVPVDWDTLMELRPQLDGLSRSRTAVMLHRYLPLAARSDEWLQWFSAAPSTPGPQRVMTSQGFTPQATPRADRAHNSARRLERALKGEKFKLSPDNKLALKRIEYLARYNEIQLWIAAPPVLDKLAKGPNFRTFDRAATKSLNRFAGGRPHVHTIARAESFPADQMASATHVASSVAATYTRALARRLGITSTARTQSAPSVQAVSPTPAPNNPAQMVTGAQ